MAYDYRNKCGSCVRMDVRKRQGYNCYCEKRDAYYSAKDDRICYAYEYDRYRDYNELDFEEQRNNSCYITTMVCDILNLPDNNSYLVPLRIFRRDVLQKDPKYANILYEYDTVGPLIAEQLRNDKDKLKVARKIVKNYLTPIVLYIEHHYYNEAILLYQKMTNILKDGYGIVCEFEVEKDYDNTNGGHGYKKTLKKF